MQEGLMLAVKISKEVLSWFGKIEDGLEIDNLGRYGGYIGKFLSKEAQVTKIRHNVLGLWTLT